MAERSARSKGLSLAAAEYPAGFVFYKMCPAGLLQGLPPDADVSGSWTFVVIDDAGRRQHFLQKYPTTKLSIRFRHVPQDFGRLLAKVGYGQVLTQLDPGEFRPICVPYILGEEANVSYVVGGALDDPLPEPDNDYSLKTVAFGSPDRITIVALVRLLAHTSAPAYHVVVGDVVGPDQVNRVLQKLGATIEGFPTEAAALARKGWGPVVP